MDEIEKSLPTKNDVIKTCDLIVAEITKINNLREEDQEMRFKSYNEIIKLLDKLKEYEGVDNFSDILFDSSLNNQFTFLVSTPNTEISSNFVSLLTDICEENSTVIDVIKRSEYLTKALLSCLPLDEVNVQSDAQFLYNTFNLISVILDGCEDAAGFAGSLLNDTPILILIKRQLKRDDFDENVLAATETLAILLQMHPSYIEEPDPPSEDSDESSSGKEELLHLLLRFVVNEKNPKSASEDEAAHNGFNAITLFALSEKGNAILVGLGGIEMLLECWSSKAKTAMLAVESIESAVSASSASCVQFVNSGGLKKLFKELREPKTLTSRKISARVVGILDALLTTLPSGAPDDQNQEKNGVECFKKLMKKFGKVEKGSCENVSKLVKIAEFAFENAADDDEESMDVFKMCACCIAIVCGFANNNARKQLFVDINESEVIDFELIVDSAEVRIDEVKLIAPRVKTGLNVISSVLKEEEK